MSDSPAQTPATSATQAIGMVMTAFRNSGDFKSCWIWPKTKSWPSTFPTMPPGFTFSVSGKGYAELLETTEHKRINHQAQRIAYDDWNFARDPRLEKAITTILDSDPDDTESVDWQNAQWLGKLRGKDDQVRHLPDCKKGCVNPFHLYRGSAGYNAADKYWSNIKSGKVQPENETKASSLVQAYRQGASVPRLAKEIGIKPQYEAFTILLRDTDTLFAFLLEDWEGPESRA
jgi:hypothetical protein